MTRRYRFDKIPKSWEIDHQEQQYKLKMVVHWQFEPQLTQFCHQRDDAKM
ncbi:hypothetical protein H6G33_12870 [Calothrix sp. FACHB-1219]|nr:MULTISPECIES: hypothetical protein [unclassified Calothrix]MBD2202484.1 hypothetical protein [Calothrix sp. FACHB-168]MBD2217925.1 hypothetical protein [Calothrix sp. FACHB-1219]